MSALPPKADIATAAQYVRLVPCLRIGKPESGVGYPAGYRLGGSGMSAIGTERTLVLSIRRAWIE